MFLVVVFCIPSTASDCATSMDPVPNGRRLVNGGEIAGQFPWQLATSGGCGAIVIGKKYALTAAHCSFRNSGYVICGVMHASKGSRKNQQKLNIKKATNHESYRGASQGKDITLLELDGEFEWNDFCKPACLPQDGDKPKAGDEVRLSGYGMVNLNSQGDGMLKFVDFPVTDKDCSYPDHFCAGVTGSSPKSACKGDSGGPVVRLKNGRVEVVGIVSFGGDCGKTKIGKFTDVSKFNSWIKTNGGPGVSPPGANPNPTPGTDPAPSSPTPGDNPSPSSPTPGENPNPATDPPTGETPDTSLPSEDNSLLSKQWIIPLAITLVLLLLCCLRFYCKSDDGVANNSKFEAEQTKRIHRPARRRRQHNTAKRSRSSRRRSSRR